MSPLRKYFHLWTSLLDGGRWKVMAFCKWKLNEDDALSDDARNELTPVARDTTWLALIEEAMETIGGVLMSNE